MAESDDFEETPCPTLVVDRLDRKVLAVNAAARRLFGGGRTDLVGSVLDDLIPTETRAGLAGLFDSSHSAHPRGAVCGRHVEIHAAECVRDGRPALLVALFPADAESERLARLVVEHGGDGIAVVARDGTTLFVSPPVERMLGYPAADIVGRSASIYLHAEDTPFAKAPLPGTPGVAISRSRRADGSWVWLESTVMNLTEDPTVGLYLANVREVMAPPDRRAAIEAQRRLEWLLSATAAVTYACIPRGEFPVTFMSENVKTVLGYDAASYRADPRFWWDRVHPEDRPTVEAHVAELLRSGAVVMEYRFRHADGRWRWMLDQARIVHDESGAPIELVGYWVDTTERRETLEALRRSEAGLRTMLERWPSAILVHRGGRIVYANDTLVRMLGYDSPAEIVGRSPYDIVHPEDRSAVRDSMARTADEGQGPQGFLQLLRRDGTVVVTEGFGTLMDFDGEPSHVVINRDVTERNEMFSRIAVADRLLSVGTLAAGVAHEINNPLTYVLSNLTVLTRELPALLAANGGSRLSSQDLSMLLGDAREGASRVAAIVRDLRSISRGDDEAPGPVNARKVLAFSIKMAENEIRHRARLTESHEDDLVFVRGNASRLGQVFLNLLLNAAQAIPDGNASDNEIVVRSYTTADGRVVFEVADTGVGIARNLLGRIFDPFFTTKPIGVGTGLGLSICHGIVRSMAGEIEVNSEVGVGSTFRVTLPRCPALGAPATTEDAPTTVRRRVLVIDDDPAIGAAVKFLLAPEVDARPVNGARAALDVLSRDDGFDAILCDVMMPETNGIEFFSELARVAPHLRDRVVFLTGGAFTASARSFLDAVRNPVLEKPLDEESLQDAIRRVCSI